MGNKTLVFAVILLLIAGVIAVVGLQTVTEEAANVAAAVERDHFDPPTFVSIGGFTIPVIRRNAVTSQIVVIIELEVGGPGDEAAISDALPRLRDAYFTEMHSAVVWRQHKGEYRLHLPSIKRRLLEITNSIVGDGIVREVLIRGTMERRTSAG